MLEIGDVQPYHGACGSTRGCHVGEGLRIDTQTEVTQHLLSVPRQNQVNKRRITGGKS